MPAEPATRYTAEEYLELERARTEGRAEFFRGEIRLMGGASREHNRINFDLARVIGNQLEGGGCEAFANDMRVKTSSDGRYAYPDLVVVCGGAEFEDSQLDTLLNPTLIVEVLSETTAARDRGEKFESYRGLASLREYVLVAQDRPHIEHFTRLDDESWRFSPAVGLDAELSLETCGLRIRLADIYARVVFDPPTPPTEHESPA